MSSDQEKRKNDTSSYTRPLLVGAASAFAAGVFGAIWYTKRKQSKHDALIQDHLNNTAELKTNNGTTPPKMTPVEYELAKKQARFFALKSLGYGTLLALTGAGVLATAVGYWLDVRNFQEFSDKLHIIVPQRTARLRRFLGGKDLEMTKSEEEELEDLLQDITIDE
ncbi:uncharacterized protein BX664DRAFT_272820 [Halteromyces radiatus]|uniref:uncharacterized protein n=1 Tax=Halteromyces radiatus TaxID=101107 RepID=UPI00221F216B|nr:uncharacterized protein BX664DRAFT_272820 [Halteromyces radiatus]KAI8099545.1 hypothetical protein BX664DRAFT_272820 [Halteromyces radiatus]